MCPVFEREREDSDMDGINDGGRKGGKKMICSSFHLFYQFVFSEHHRNPSLTPPLTPRVLLNQCLQVCSLSHVAVAHIPLYSQAP